MEKRIQITTKIGHLNIITKAVPVFLILGLLSGCGRGFQSGSTESASLASSSPTPGPGTGSGDGSSFSDPNLAWSKLENDLSSRVSGGGHDGHHILLIDREREALVVVLPSDIPFLIAPAQSFSLNSSTPGLSVEPIPTASGMPKMGVVIPLRLLVRGANFTSYNRLPNGDPLPFLPSGEKKGFAVALPTGNRQVIHLYFGVTTFAFFVEVPGLNGIPVFFGFPIVNRQGTRQTGFFSLIAAKNGNNAGVYVATRIPNELAILIDELVKF